MQDVLELARGHVGAMIVQIDQVGAEIVVDDMPIGTAPLLDPVFVAPGSHRFEARATERANHGRASGRGLADHGAQLCPEGGEGDQGRACERVCKMLRRRGLLGEPRHDNNEAEQVDGALEACRRVALCRGRFERIDEQGRAQQQLFVDEAPLVVRKKNSPWVGEHNGFSLHAGVSFGALDRKTASRPQPLALATPKPIAAPGENAPDKAPVAASYVPWAVLLRRTFGFEVLQCTSCQVTMLAIAGITQRAVIDKILIRQTFCPPLRLDRVNRGRNGIPVCGRTLQHVTSLPRRRGEGAGAGAPMRRQG